MWFRIKVLFILCVTAPAFAQPVPKLNSLSREWIQRGTKAQLTVSGENLTSLTDVYISGAPGVTATIVIREEPAIRVESSAGGITSVARGKNDHAEISLGIEPDASLTDREIRLVSMDGVSNPLVIHVTPYRELDSTNTSTREDAQRIELPVAVNGAISGAAESDFFRLNAKKGQHLIAEIYAARIGSKLDSSVMAYDHSGKELARNEDAIGLDSVLDFDVPEDGEYLLEVRDFRYQGGGDYRYRLVVGVLPYIWRAFPYGGQRGRTLDIALDGVNLDSHTLTLNLATNAAAGRQEIRASSGGGLSNPFPFEVSDLPDFSETEPNSALDQADRISIPVAIHGRIGKRKDYDAYRFAASAGQRIIFEVSAFRNGSPLDAVLTLLDSTGELLQKNDDATGEDARIDYTFKEAGDYHLVVEDLLARGGPEYGYRLTADLPQPDFSVTVVGDLFRLHRGGHVPIRCEINRVNGFDGPVVVSCENLPAGVHADPFLLPFGADVSAGYLSLTADEEAPRGSFPLKIVGRATAGGRVLAHGAQALSNDRPVKQAFLTVVNRAPFYLFSPTPMASIEQNQSGEIEVIVERRNGFNGEIKIVPEGFSAGRDPISKSFDVQPLTLKAGETRGKVSLKARTDSEIGRRRVVLRAATDSGIADYSPLIPLSTTQIPFVLSTSLKKLVVTALPASSGSAASEGVFNAKLERRGGFEGEVELVLEGVPAGVTATVTNIAAKANESILKLVATERAPTGTNVQLTLTGIGTQNDRTYRFQAPPIILTIGAPESEEKKEPKLANKP